MTYCLCSDPDYCLRRSAPEYRERAIAYRREHGAPLPAEGDYVSTRRKVRSGVVHEMADRGVKSLCRRDLPEPWQWTDDVVTCKRCLASPPAGGDDDCA